MHNRLQQHRKSLGQARRLQGLEDRLTNLRQQIQESKRRLNDERDAVLERKRALAPRAEQAAAAVRTLSATKADFAKARAVFQEKRQDVIRVKHMLHARQANLIAGVSSIYPITQAGADSPWTIRNCQFPRPHVQGNDDETAAALGYLCELLDCVSRYGYIPLRYPIRCCASRSTISESPSIPSVHLNGPTSRGGAARSSFSANVGASTSAPRSFGLSNTMPVPSSSKHNSPLVDAITALQPIELPLYRLNRNDADKFDWALFFLYKNIQQILAWPEFRAGGVLRPVMPKFDVLINIIGPSSFLPRSDLLPSVILGR
eukprot:Rmarinus@m.12233